MFQKQLVMLASASIGAIFSSASPDFGVEGVLDRFGQIEPKILLLQMAIILMVKKLILPKKGKKVVNSLLPC